MIFIMKKLLFVVFIGILLASCKKNISALNQEYKRPIIVTPKFLFANAQKELVDAITTPDVNFNTFRLTAQFWTATTYNQESNYDFDRRQVSQGWWGLLYRDVLKNLDEAKKLILAQDTVLVSVKVQKNQLAVSEILEVYTYAMLVNTFGNVPYTEALDINNLNPKYDNAKEIYYDLLDRLDVALNDLDLGQESFKASDLFYNGRVSSWKKFGNSLKLKLGMILADFDDAKAQQVVNEAAVVSNLIQSNDENVTLKYLQTRPNTNPIYDFFVIQGRDVDFVIAKTIIDTMQQLNDPRISLYFDTIKGGSYVGGIVGRINDYDDFSKPNAKMITTDFPAVLMDYAEVEFLLCEAKARGWASNVAGTAQDHYNKAIEASILYWGGSVADYNTYIMQPSVNYATATGDYKRKIGIQKWIALYNRGFDAWTEIRRLDWPKLPNPANRVSDFPLRFKYPIEEQTLNSENYSRASAAMGGDLVTSRIFWDK